MFIWKSAGGCERCDALEGEHEQEPSRPHPNCNCKIEALDPACTYVAVMDLPGDDIIRITVRVDCGFRLVERSVDVKWDSLDPERAVEELEEKERELAEKLCDICQRIA